MNQKENNELRRRFRADKSNISRIYGCFVNTKKEIVAYIDSSLGMMKQEEAVLIPGAVLMTLSAEEASAALEARK